MRAEYKVCLVALLLLSSLVGAEDLNTTTSTTSTTSLNTTSSLDTTTSADTTVSTTLNTTTVAASVSFQTSISQLQQLIPVVTANSCGYEITNFTQDDMVTIPAFKGFTITENYITPTSAGLTVNEQSKEIPLGGNDIFVDRYSVKVTNIDFEPSWVVVSVLVCHISIPTSTTSATTSITTTLTQLSTIISHQIPTSISSITSSRTTTLTTTLTTKLPTTTVSNTISNGSPAPKGSIPIYIWIAIVAVICIVAFFIYYKS